jgi:hypothetical protein
VTRLNWGMFGSFLSAFFKSSLGPPRDTMGRRFAGWSYWEGGFTPAAGNLLS